MKTKVTHKNKTAAPKGTKRKTQTKKGHDIAYYKDVVDPEELEEYLESGRYLLFKDMPRRAQKRAVAQFKKKQALNSKSVKMMFDHLKYGSPVLYDTQEETLTLPISKPGLDGEGHSSINISTDLVSPGALEAAAAIYLPGLRKVMTKAEIEKARAVEKERQKAELLEDGDAIDQALLEEWFKMEQASDYVPPTKPEFEGQRLLSKEEVLAAVKKGKADGERVSGYRKEWDK